MIQTLRLILFLPVYALCLVVFGVYVAAEWIAFFIKGEDPDRKLRP